MKTIQELHEACIIKAAAITREHPYILEESVKVYERPESIRVLSCYDYSPDITRVKAVFTFKTRNGEDRDGLFAVFVSEIEHIASTKIPDYVESRFQVGLLKMDSFGHAERILHLEDMAVFNSEIQMLVLFYGAIMDDCLVAFKYGWGNYRFPKEWRKSFEKSVKRFFPDKAPRLGYVAKNPTFYPYGTLVEFGAHIRQEGSRVRRVVSICENGVGSYLIHTDHYADKEPVYGEKRESINTSHVDKIIKRGTGPVYTPSMAAVLYDKERENSITPNLSFYECQKKAERMLFEDTTGTKKRWDVARGGVSFCTDYALTFRQGLLDHGFEYQFDAYRFLANVSVREKGDLITWDVKINKKKFKRQMKRRHCYFSKIRHLVREVEIEDERSMGDF